GMAVFDEKDFGGVGLKGGSGIEILLGTGEVQQIHMVDNTMKDKKWHHIVGVCERRGVKMYLDGEIILQPIDKANINFKGVNEEDLRIGCVKNKPQYAFEGGSIDEVAIWDRALSEDEVRTTMRGPLLAVSPKDKAATTWGNIKR
ncbi:MAG: LamG domain-containing protein, partial [Proteobacteria bacterium]|nr:LamG domain-containing protein [Pseudomonadota bacterium]